MNIMIDWGLVKKIVGVVKDWSGILTEVGFLSFGNIFFRARRITSFELLSSLPMKYLDDYPDDMIWLVTILIVGLYLW